MSEPMSSVEIEDVLSSIRRLVSEDLRPAPKAAAEPVDVPVAATAVVSPMPARAPVPREDKLLLTPALRVVSDRAAAPRATPLPRLHLGVESRRDDLVAALDRSLNIEAVDFESETGDPAPTIAQMEWTEDGWALAPEPAPQSNEPSVAPWDQADETYADLASPTPAEEAEAWADRAEAEVVAALDRAADATPPVGEAGVSPPQEAGEDPLEVVFDEQVLRELVRDILREELQGRLGERITRNVRKLVHAEIARLVAAQDLD